MPSALKKYFADNFKLALDADEAAVKAMASEKIKSGDLTLEKYNELIATKTDEPPPANKAAELADTIANKTAAAVASALVGPLGAIAESLKGATPKPKEVPATKVDEVDDKKELADMEARLEERLAAKFSKQAIGGDGASLMDMAANYKDDDPATIRVKEHVERFSHSPTAIIYKSQRAKLLGLHGQPMQMEDGREIMSPTERTKFMCAVWMKFQMFPERLNEQEVGVVRYILNREKFHVPNQHGASDARLLSEGERAAVWDYNKNFYAHGHSKTLLDDSASGGENAVPEFFDMDMIVSPTLANEDLPSFCNVVMVPRGSSARNFKLGRPTIAANVEGTGVVPFTTTGFITAHNTEFFRAMGAIKIGRNFQEDAHPRLVSEIQAQYVNSVRLWYNEQITSGDGTTEPQGVKNASNTIDVTPTTPTAGPLVAADLMEMLFAVPKAYRENGGRGNAIYVMRDLTYQRSRGIVTGVTGDTRWIFGDDVESYKILNHPVLIEERGMQNDEMIYFQAKGYRLYIRQGTRFFREDRGSTLTLDNTFLVGCDLRAGGQLDEGQYAAVADGFMP